MLKVQLYIDIFASATNDSEDTDLCVHACSWFWHLNALENKILYSSFLISSIQRLIPYLFASISICFLVGKTNSIGCSRTMKTRAIPLDNIINGRVFRAVRAKSWMTKILIPWLQAFTCKGLDTCCYSLLSFA